MKRLVAAGGFFALALTASAQNTDQTVVVPASKEATLQRVYTSPEDFRLYKGEYSLSNGKALHLTRQGARMYARVDQQPEHEIIRTGEGKFLALDGKMSMQIAWDGPGSVSGELSYIDESRPVAGLPPARITISLASR